METVVGAMSYDGLVTVVGCDKNMPGALMAMLRLNRPSVLCYGGTIASGKYKNRKLDIVSAFEAWGEKVSGKIDDNEFQCIIAVPGLGPVEECIRQTLWLLQLRRWDSVYQIILQFCSIKTKNNDVARIGL